MGHRSPPLVITQIEVDRSVDVATPTCILVAVEWTRLVYFNASLRTCTRSNFGRRYCDDGAIKIDKSAAERALRGVATGRRNYLFAGAESGGAPP
jgi:hypothetical protein